MTTIHTQQGSINMSNLMMKQSLNANYTMSVKVFADRAAELLGIEKPVANFFIRKMKEDGLIPMGSRGRPLRHKQELKSGAINIEHAAHILLGLLGAETAFTAAEVARQAGALPYTGLDADPSEPPSTLLQDLHMYLTAYLKYNDVQYGMEIILTSDARTKTPCYARLRFPCPLDDSVKERQLHYGKHPSRSTAVRTGTASQTIVRTLFALFHDAKQ